MIRAMTPAEVFAVGERIQYVPTANARGLCNGDEETPLGACILYDSWCPNSVCVHSYIPHPRFMTKGFLREMWRYPLEHVDWVIGVTPGDNARALAFNKRIGLTEVYRLKDGWATGVDQVFQTAHYSTCRWWKRPA